MTSLLQGAAALVLCAFSVCSAQSVPNWRLGAPFVRILNDGREATQFTNAVAFRLPNGEVAVLDGGSRQLRVFNTTGELLRTLSRKGQGPGEIQTASAWSRSHDTIFVAEVPPDDNLVHEFSARSGFIRRTRITSQRPRAAAVARLKTGQWIVKYNSMRILQGLAVGQLRMDSVSMGLLNLETNAEVALGRIALGTFTAYAVSPTGPIGATLARFAPREEVIAAGNKIWIVNTATGAVRVLASNGILDTTFVLDLPRRSFDKSAAARARMRSVREAASPAIAAQVRASFDAITPSEAPVLASIMSSKSGEVWVELFREDDTQPAEYVVVTASGASLGRVRLPARVRMTESGSDYVVGVRTDQDEQEEVVGYSLTRSSGTRP